MNKDFHAFLKAYLIMHKDIRTCSRSQMNYYIECIYGKEIKQCLRDLFLYKNNNKIMFAMKSQECIIRQATNYILNIDIIPKDLWSNYNSYETIS